MFHVLFFVPVKILLQFSTRSFPQDKLMFSDNEGRQDGKYQSIFLI